MIVAVACVLDHQGCSCDKVSCFDAPTDFTLNAVMRRLVAQTELRLRQELNRAVGPPQRFQVDIPSQPVLPTSVAS